MFVPSPQLTVIEPRERGPLHARVYPSSVVTAPSKSTICPADHASPARPLRLRHVKRDRRTAVQSGRDRHVGDRVAGVLEARAVLDQPLPTGLGDDLE